MTPIPFVVGAPRSGTTLLRLMLDAHPELSVPPETHFYAPVLAIDPTVDGWADAVVDAMVTSHNWGDHHLAAGAFADAVRAAAPVDVGTILRLFYRTYAARFGKHRGGDKCPGNVLRMRSIADVLPEARFVHLIRDGRDVAVSLREAWFRPADSLEACIDLWAGRVRAGREQAALGVPYLEIRYESLVRETAATLRIVCEFAEISFDAAMLDYHEQARERLDEFTDPPRAGFIPRAEQIALHRLTERRPLETRIGRWRELMTPEEAASLAAATGGLLAELGYGKAVLS